MEGGQKDQPSAWQDDPSEGGGMEGPGTWPKAVFHPDTWGQVADMARDEHKSEADMLRDLIHRQIWLNEQVREGNVSVKLGRRWYRLQPQSPWPSVSPERGRR